MLRGMHRKNYKWGEGRKQRELIVEWGEGNRGRTGHALRREKAGREEIVEWGEGCI